MPLDVLDNNWWTDPEATGETDPEAGKKTGLRTAETWDRIAACNCVFYHHRCVNCAEKVELTTTWF